MVESNRQSSGPDSSILVAPMCKTQTWYPRILEISSGYHWMISVTNNLIMSDNFTQIPQLAIWIISGEDTESNSFQRKLQSSRFNYEIEICIEVLWPSGLSLPLAGAIQGVLCHIGEVIADLFIQGYNYCFQISNIFCAWQSQWLWCGAASSG